ncbi:MFS transporter, partial [Candidatus Parcubacteria bacterium]|nr:MFS transporter [Candidatus Parcubacteria bacterium]
FMLIPFVLLEYPAGFLADRKLGEKEMLIVALFIIGLSTFWLYFIDSVNPYLWGVSLFVTRIGASLLEIMRDSYFYKRIDGHDVDIINFFRTSSPTGYILGAILSGILLLFFPLKSVFILVALLAFSGLYPAFKLVDNKSEDEI